jgi:TonB family protein
MKYLEIKTVKVRVDTIWLRDLVEKTKLLLHRQRARYSLATLVSINTHLLLICGYWALSALSEPPVVELREISFMDLSEETDEVVRGTDDVVPTIKKEVPKTSPKPKKKTPKKVAPKKQPKRESPKMDMIRKQAPISLASHAPIDVARTKASDLIKMSPAKGTQDGKKLMNLSSSITLNKNKRLRLPAKKTQKAAVRSRESRPQIALNSKRMSPKILVTKPPVKPLQPNLLEQGRSSAARKSRVFITGPLSSRKILERSIPKFPRWAKRKGVGASISLQFTVMADGKVKENVVVVRTSGSKEWDDAVIATLKTWLFELLPQNTRLQDQTGVITFQFVID